MSGFKNTNSQIAATFTSDGTYVISASEDSQVFIWRTEEPRNIGIGKRSVITARGHEYFPCKDVSVAITWPGTNKIEPPSMTGSSHLKRNSKSSQGVANGESPTKNDHNKRNLPLPPLPKKKSNHHVDKIITMPDEDSETADSVSRSSTASASSRSSSVSNDDSSSTSSMSRSSTLSGASNLNSSGSKRDSGSIRYGDSPSISSLIGSSSWSWINVSCNGQNAAAWGLVIVTATLSGEIRIYQNFGLPRRVSRL